MSSLAQKRGEQALRPSRGGRPPCLSGRAEHARRVTHTVGGAPRAPAATEGCRDASGSFARLARGALISALLLSGCDQLGFDAAGAPAAPPKLVFAETTYDFGRVAQGTAVEHRFPFVNDGGAELTIMDLRAACDYEATLVGARDVAPRAAGAVQGRFDTDAVYGAQRRTITVYSNDPVRRAVLLTVTGEVVLDVVADPPQVYLGAVPPGTPLLRAVALRTGSDAVRIGLPQSDASQLALQLADAPDGAAAAVLAIGTASAAPLGPFAAVVRVPTTSPRHPVLRIAVSGIIDAGASPPRPVGSPSQPDDGHAVPPGSQPEGR